MSIKAQDHTLFDVAEELADVKPKRLPGYSAYRESNIDWIGAVPDHWHLFRAKWTVTTCRNGIWGSEPDSVNDIACVRVADFDRTRLSVIVESPTMRAVTPRERQGRALKPGDLLLEKSGGGELQPVGAVMVFDHEIDAVCSNFVARMPVAKGYDTWFLAYLHSHLYAGRVNTRSIKQSIGIQNLDSRQYLDELIPLPPLDEQRSISAFLRRETARIDELVEKKRRLIELLREKRTALISHAVTKGLNPNAPMKPSGIDWLGDVPKHWEVRAFRYSARIANGQVDPEDNDYRDLPLIAPNHIESATGRLLDYDTAAEQAAESGKYLFEAGNVLYSKIRPALAKVCIAPERGLCSADMYPITPKSDLRPAFLMYYMLTKSFTDAVILLSSRVAMPKMNRRDLGGLAVVVPPLVEQDTIIATIEASHGEIDRVRTDIASAIARLMEYRAALISAAVTGKIDVRGEVTA